MITPTELVQYLRDNRSSDTWKVDYGATYAAATDKSKLPMPCFYVELAEDSATVESDGDYLQLLRVPFRIRMVCKSQEDRMGRTGADVAKMAQLELWKILLFKKLKPSYNEVYYVRGGFAGFDEARYIQEFDFFFTVKLDPTALTVGEFVNLGSIHIDYDLVDSDESEKPNAQDVLDTFQD